MSDKTGSLDLAGGHAACQIDLISTGGLRMALADTGLWLRDSAEVTDIPEMLDGCITTLYPRIHSGILAV